MPTRRRELGTGLGVGVLAGLVVLIAACSQPGDQTGAGELRDATPKGATATAQATGPSPALAVVTTYRSPTCGCCVGWEEYMRAEGFGVESVVTDDVAAIKDDLQIPDEMRSCHTAIIGEYFVEGHVPAEAIQKLLEEQPEIDGIALPGMPQGSPGMGGEKSEPFVIYSVSNGLVAEFTTI